MKSDLHIALKAKMVPITKVAADIGLRERELELFGQYKAKVELCAKERVSKFSPGKYILVSAITPTPLGEGKTLTTIGLSMALHRYFGSTAACLRQPSLGPVFGIKGGAAGGGYSQVLPMQDVNLHLTGDTHAVDVAHNLCSAFLDNAIFRNKLNIDPKNISWQRVVEVSDRALRHVKINSGQAGYERDGGFFITVASEIMAILALSKDLKDLRKRLSKIVVAKSRTGRPITCQDLKVAGAMAVLLKDAIKPNLIQTIEHSPCFMHTGPFANIAHGNSSVIADELALSLCDFVVTEAGFGADCGAEKFMNIKCRVSGLRPDCVVLVSSVRALKMHSGRFKVRAGKPLMPALLKEDLNALREGSVNLRRHIKNLSLFGVPVVVAVNRFKTDTDKEIQEVRNISCSSGAFAAEESTAWEHGSKGAKDLARAVVRACGSKKNFSFLYPLHTPIKEKIRTIAEKIYQAKDVQFSAVSEKKISEYEKLGFSDLPICMAKTHLSISHDPELKGDPCGYVLPVRDIKLSAGAGFLYPLCGQIQTMPGLPSKPAGENIDINPQGRIRGLF